MCEMFAETKEENKKQIKTDCICLRAALEKTWFHL